MAESMSLRQYAAHAGVNVSTISRQVAAGVIPTTPDGRIDPAKADRARARNLDHSKPRAKARRGAEKVSLAETLRQKAVEEVRFKRVQALKAEEAVVDVEEVRHVVEALAASFRIGLDALPGRMAAALAGISDPARVKELLADECRQILDAISRDLQRRASDWPRGIAAATTAEADARSMVGAMPDPAAG